MRCVTQGVDPRAKREDDDFLIETPRLLLRDGTLGDVRVALGAAMERAVRLHSVEAQLEGERPSAELVRRAGDSAAQEVRPLGDLRGSAEYKREMVRVHARRAIDTVLQTLAFEEAVR